MAKKLRYSFASIAAIMLAFAFAPGGAFACEVDGLSQGLANSETGLEQVGYISPGGQPAGDLPGSPALEIPRTAPHNTTDLQVILVLGMALLAAPLFAALTVLAARMNHRR